MVCPEIQASLVIIFIGKSCMGKKYPLDPINNLIFYRIEVVKLLKPRLVIFENVPMPQHNLISCNGKIVEILECVLNKLGNNSVFDER